jgi:hypothetical protein
MLVRSFPGCNCLRFEGKYIYFEVFTQGSFLVKKGGSSNYLSEKDSLDFCILGAL